MATTKPNVAALASGGTYPAGDGSNLTGLPPDYTFDIGQLYLLGARLDTPTTPNAGGTQVADEFDDATGISSLGSGTVAGGYLSGMAPSSTTTTHTTATTPTNGGYFMADTTFLLPNSKTLTTVGLYSTVATTVRFKIMQWNGSTGFTFVQSQAMSHGGGGWQDVTLSTPYAIPASGSYLVSVYTDSALSMTSDSFAGYYYIHAEPTTGSYTGTSAGSAGNMAILRYTTLTGPSNITTISNAYTALTTPTTVSFVVEYQDVSTTATLNTDFIVSVSRDNGTTWTAVTLSALGPSPISGATVLKGTATVSGQPSGTSLKWKVVTANTKEQRVPGIWMQWK